MADIFVRSKKRAKFADSVAKKFQYTAVKVSYDEKDVAVLEILKQNARTPFTEIAKSLRLSESTIRKRVYALEEKRIIRKYTIEIDPKLINYEIVANIKLDVEADQIPKIVEELTPHPDIRDIKLTTGEYMISFEFWAKSSAYLNAFISNWLGKIEGIKKIIPEIIIEQFKGN